MSGDELPRPLRLACTTDHLWKLLRGIERDWQAEGKPVHLHVPEAPQGAEGLPYPDIIAAFYGPEHDWLTGLKLHGGIRAKLEPYSITLMTLVVKPGSWPEPLAPYWARIVEVIDEWVIPETSEPPIKLPAAPEPDGNAPLREHRRWWDAHGKASGYTSKADYARHIGVRPGSMSEAGRRLKNRDNKSEGV